MKLWEVAAVTHVQLALSERNREPVLTFFLQRKIPYLPVFPHSSFVASTINVSCSVPPVSVSPAQLPSQQQLQPPSFTPSTCIQKFLRPSPSSCICSKQRPSYVPLSVEDAARVPPCSAPLALIPSPPFRFESGLRAAHVYCPILGTSPATGELFPA
jgi:hypothetical protein